MIWSEVYALVQKEIRLELKQKYVLNGILLYLVSTVFVTYLAFGDVINPETWNALFWIILLFVAVNGISKSFLQESRGRYLYYYTIASPQAVVLSKIVYNLLLMLLLSVIAFAVFLLLMGNRIVNLPLFLAALLLGSMGLSAILTMVAAIASRASQNFSLMAILSFPIILPLLHMLMKIAGNAIQGYDAEGVTGALVILVTINFSVIFLAYLLFPYLWKD